MLASPDFTLSLSQSISLERTTWEGGGGRQDQEGTSDLKHSWKQFLVGFICPVSSSYIPQMMAGCPVLKIGFGPMTEESKKLKNIVIFAGVTKKYQKFIFEYSSSSLKSGKQIGKIVRASYC